MQAPASMCEGCGYDVGSLPAGTPCPECGVTTDKRLTPWPGVFSVVWHIVRVQSVAAGVMLVLFSGWGTARMCGLEAVAILLGCLTVGAVFMLLVLLIFWPLAQAELLAERYQPRRSRHGPYTGLLLLGWVASVLVGTVLLALLAVSALLIGLAS